MALYKVPLDGVSNVGGWHYELSVDGATQCLKVTNVMPGVTNTGIWAGGAGSIGMDPKQTEEIGATILQPEDVATLVWETVCKPERSAGVGWGGYLHRIFRYYVKDVFMQATNMPL